MQFALLMLGGVLAGLYFYERWSVRATPAQRARTVRKLALMVVGGALLILVLRTAPALLLPLLPLLVPILLRGGVGGRWRFHGAGGFDGLHRKPRPGATSEVVTRFFRMSLDHASGAMTGTVLEGPYQGRSLSDLNLEQLLNLWRSCQVDTQSAAVLEAYLERTQNADWRQQAASGERDGGHSAMDRQEAYAILGLAPGASPEEIKTAHRRLMQKLHPDHGGSDWLAARINQAKDLLLGE